MGDIKLFRFGGEGVAELQGSSFAVEKSLQALIERNLEAILGVRFLASEYSTGKTHSGRIDTLGIDENGCPVIIEYKRAQNENVINQGLFYLDWLMDHKADFKILVLDKCSKKDADADAIEWSSPRLLCIASDFTRYDEHAVQQINRNIELIRYRKYGAELLLFDLVNAVGAQPPGDTEVVPPVTPTAYKTISQVHTEIDPDLRDRFELMKAYLVALGDDVQMKALKYYYAFRRIKNFACVEFRPQKREILVFVKVDPHSIPLEQGFTRDVSAIGHFGTGELEITIKSNDDLERAKPLLFRSYEVS